MGFYHIAQADLKLLSSGDPPPLSLLSSGRDYRHMPLLPG
jgi:hypothetical protein